MKRLGKLLSLMMVLLLALSLGSVAMADEPLLIAPAPSAANGTIAIIYTNDVHCGVEDGIGYAGVAGFKADLEALYGEGYVTLIDAGDFSQGGVLGTLSNGEYLIEIMNATGYDIATIGNHEYDYGMEKAIENLTALDADIICCNFIDLTTGEPVFDAYKLVTYGETVVAYVGISTPESFTKSTPTYFQNAEGEYIYSFAEGNNGKDLYTTVQKAVDAARAEGADYVIAVGHLGIDVESSPWMSTEVIANTTGIDAFIDAHSHSTIVGDKVKNAKGEEVLLTSTGTKLANVGCMTITKDGITSELISENVTPDAEVAKAVADVLAENDALLKTVVAKTSVDLTINDPDTGKRMVRSRETNLGDLCADAYLTLLEADVAFVNGGGVRANIPAGDITYEQIIAVHPFGNEACLVEVTGQQILDALEMGYRNVGISESGGFLHVAGLTCTIDTTVASTVVIDDKDSFVEVAGERRVKDVMIGGEPIDAAATYTLASHNYMLKSAGDGYTMFGTNNVTMIKDCVLIDNQVLINYIVEELGGVVGADYANPYGQGRIDIVTAFADVAAGDWYAGAANYVYNNALMGGVGEGNFAPRANMNRATFVTMLYRLAGSPEVTAEVTFTDVEAGIWYEKAAAWAVEKGITAGTVADADAITFDPLGLLTREQMAAFIYRYDGSPATMEELTFTDMYAISPWALNAVRYCVDAGYMQGMTDTLFIPSGLANRASGATVLMNMHKAQ